MAITDADIKRAEAAALRRMASGPRAVAARYDRRLARIVVSLDNNIDVTFAPGLAEGLGNATPAGLSLIEISATGLGLHWPKLDADIYLPALLSGMFGSRRWMAGLMGKAGGSSRSKAKAAASRTNGGRGGRPRKVARG